MLHNEEDDSFLLTRNEDDSYYQHRKSIELSVNLVSKYRPLFNVAHEV